MTTATQTAKRKRATTKAVRVGFARFCESFSAGDAPTNARILRAGVNTTDKGDLNFTPRSAKLVAQAFAKRGNPLAWYYNHEDQLPIEEQGGAPMKGACSAPSSDLVIRDSPTGPECWAENIAWTDEAKRQIKSGERRQLSPVAAYDKDTREVIEIVNVSLVGEGATHNGTLLASRDGGENRSSDMDELEQALEEAIASGDYEEAENIIQKMEEMGGEGMVKAVKYARMAVKCAKEKEPPPAQPAAPAAAKRLAAARGPLAAQGINMEAFDRAVADMTAATREARSAATESRRATVQTLITANRDLFDVVDERQHLDAADPAASQRHIASLSRKVKGGTIALSKPGEQKPEAQPGGRPGAKEDELTPGERINMDSFNRGERDPKKHLTEADMIAARRRHGGQPPIVGRA